MMILFYASCAIYHTVSSSCFECLQQIRDIHSNELETSAEHPAPELSENLVSSSFDQSSTTVEFRARVSEARQRTISAKQKIEEIIKEAMRLSRNKFHIDLHVNSPN